MDDSSSLTYDQDFEKQDTQIMLKVPLLKLVPRTKSQGFLNNKHILLPGRVLFRNIMATTSPSSTLLLKRVRPNVGLL
jgi:hypothetical protein